MEPTRIGLWQGDGNTYKHSKPVEIFGVKCWVNLYQNDQKGNDKAPLWNLVLKPLEEDKAPF